MAMRSTMGIREESSVPGSTVTSLGSAHVLLTGGTGFVGQAILERLLSSHPDTTVTLLIRPKAGTSALARLRHLLKKPVFASWRERVGYVLGPPGWVPSEGPVDDQVRPRG